MSTMDREPQLVEVEPAGRTARLPGYVNRDRPPTTEPTVVGSSSPEPATSSSTAWSTSTSTGTDPETASGESGSGSGGRGGSEDGDEPLSIPTLNAGRSRGSTAELAGALFPLISMGVVLAGMGMHRWRTPGDSTVWIPGEVEIEAIASPMARIAARNLPAGAGGVANPDVADAIEAVVAVTAFASQQLIAEQQLAGSSSGDGDGEDRG